jgi:transcription elongation factor Elf1
MYNRSFLYETSVTCPRCYGEAYLILVQTSLQSPEEIAHFHRCGKCGLAFERQEPVLQPALVS